MKFRVVSDSACDLMQSEWNEYQIAMVPFYVSFEESVYQKEHVEIPVLKFYQKMVDNPNIFPKTAMPTPADYIAVFREIASQGQDILCFCITAGFSGSYQSANLARQEVLDEFPERTIIVIDSMCATVQQGLLVLECAKAAKQGADIQEVANWVEETKKYARIYFTTADLSYLQKGGRIGKVVKLAAVALKIKPLMEMKEGELHPIGISRSRKKSMASVLSEIDKHIAGISDINSYIFAVGHGYDKEEGELFCQQVQQKLQALGYKQNIQLYQIGATIGVHTGPYPIGFGYAKRWNPTQGE